jgi:hypothetical protein
MFGTEDDGARDITVNLHLVEGCTDNRALHCIALVGRKVSSCDCVATYGKVVTFISCCGIVSLHATLEDDTGKKFCFGF